MDGFQYCDCTHTGNLFPGKPVVPMIAKRIPIKQAEKSSFQRLAAYIAQGDKQERVGRQGRSILNAFVIQ